MKVLLYLIAVGIVIYLVGLGIIVYISSGID